jgi:serine/threonine protein kinase
MHGAAGALGRLQPGQVCGSYLVKRFVGRGGMGEVYEARHTTLERRVALKVLSGHLASDERSLARFFREGRAAAAVRHPHIIDVFDCGVHDGIVFLAMEFVDGDTLAQYLSRSGMLDEEHTGRLVGPIVEAVAALHQAKIIHRDLKPSNILLAETSLGPWPVVTDFGVSRFEPEPRFSASSTMLGTPAYMAPEVVEAPCAANARSDQYSLGAILYECSTGRRPFEGETSYALMHAIVTAPLTPPSAHNKSLSPEWDSLVMRAMDRDPARRFRTLQELGWQLGRFARTDSSGWARGTGSRPDTQAPRAQAVRLRATVAAACAGGLIATVFLVGNRVTPVAPMPRSLANGHGPATTAEAPFVAQVGRAEAVPAPPSPGSSMGQRSTPVRQAPAQPHRAAPAASAAALTEAPILDIDP